MTEKELIAFKKLQREIAIINAFSIDNQILPENLRYEETQKYTTMVPLHKLVTAINEFQFSFEKEEK